MNLLSIPVFVLLSVSVAFGQSDFRTGFLINQQHDTIPGFIHYKEKNFEVCTFKTEPGADPTTYSPEDIQAYWFENDKYFESRSDKVIDSTQRVFVEVLVKGKVSLFHYKGRFFVEKDSLEFHEMKSEKTVVTIKGKVGYKESTKHIGILKYLLYECDHLAPSIEDVKIGEKSLTRLIETYNACISANYVSYKERKPWTRLTFGAAAGYFISRLDYSIKHANNANYLTANDFQSEIFSTGGILDIASPRIHERFSFHLEAWYIAPRYFLYFEEASSFSIERNDVFVNYSALQIPAAVRYTFPFRKFTPFLNAGITNSWTFEGESKRIQETESVSSKRVTTLESSPVEIAQHQLGIYGSTGLHYALGTKSTVFLETRFEQGNGLVYDKFNPNNPLNSKTTTFSIITGINF